MNYLVTYNVWKLPINYWLLRKHDHSVNYMKKDNLLAMNLLLLPIARCLNNLKLYRLPGYVYYKLTR